MLPSLFFVSNWINLAVMMESPTAQVILAAILALLVLYAQYRCGMQAVPVWFEYKWHLFLSSHELHMRVSLIASVLVIAVCSVVLIGMLTIGYVQAWMTMPFSMPLSVSAAVTLLISVMPLLIGAPMLIFIKRYPPQTWMSSRVARLSHPF